MTKAIRWGLSALMTVGCIGLGSVAGCSDDEPVAVTDPDTGTPPTDTGSDTGTPLMDTGTAAETSTDTGSGDGEAGPPVPANRAVTVVFASPDLGGKYICAGAFAGDIKAATSSPAQTLGPPAGIPDPAAPTDPTKFKPLPYGAVVPVPLSKAAQDVLDTPLSVVLYLVDGITKDCKAAWPDVRAKENLWFAIKGTAAAGADATNSVKADEHALIRIHGCLNAATTGTTECGTVAAPAMLKIDMKKLDTAKPATYAGTTGPKVGLQFVHMSPFSGSAAPPAPPFQNIDVWFQPMTAAVAGSDAGTDADEAGSPSMPAAMPVKIATAVKYMDIAPTSVGVQIAGDPNSALLFLTPTGVAPCTPGSTGCLTVPLPVGGAAARYKMLGVGGFDDGTNQFVGLAGSPIPKDLTMPKTTTTIGLPVGKVRLK